MKHVNAMANLMLKDRVGEEVLGVEYNGKNKLEVYSFREENIPSVFEKKSPKEPQNSRIAYTGRRDNFSPN